MKLLKKKKFLRPSLATSDQSQSLSDREMRNESGRRRTVRRRKRRTSKSHATDDTKPLNAQIARDEPVEFVSCEQRSTRIVCFALQIAAVLAALGVAYLAYRGVRSGSGEAWVGVLGSLALLAIAMFSLKKMHEPSDWDPANLRPRGERRRRRRSSKGSSEHPGS